MSNKIECEIIQDLLPLYIDGLTHDKTNHAIREHLDSCHVCKSKFQNMTEAFETEDEATGAMKEIDYLKKIKKKNTKKIIVGVVITIVAIAVAGFLKLFVWGYPINTYAAKIQVADEGTVKVHGEFYDSSSVYSRYKIKEQDGQNQLIVYGCLPSIWNKDGQFDMSYRLDNKDFNVNGNVVTADGKLITKKAIDLFDSKNQYIGNMSANGKLSWTLGISSDLGSYLNSLQTSKEPYGWTFEFQEEVSAQNQVYFNERMEAYAQVLLALTENCSEISWQYSLDGEQYTKTVTKEQASEMLGNNIKQYAESPLKVQELMDLTGIK